MRATSAERLLISARSARIHQYAQEDFFGLGIDSSESGRTNYLLDVVESGGAVHWRPFKLDFGAAAGYLAPRVGHGQDSRFPSTEDRFSAASTRASAHRPTS